MQITETQLDQLTPETTYRVEVLALTSDGKTSPPSDWVEFTTEHDSGRSHNFEPFSCRRKTSFYFPKPMLLVRVFFNFTFVILLHEKFLQFDWLRAVVFQLNLKYLHVKITKPLRVVV